MTRITFTIGGPGGADRTDVTITDKLHGLPGCVLILEPVRYDGTRGQTTSVSLPKVNAMMLAAVLRAGEV